MIIKFSNKHEGVLIYLNFILTLSFLFLIQGKENYNNTLIYILKMLLILVMLSFGYLPGIFSQMLFIRKNKIIRFRFPFISVLNSENIEILIDSDSLIASQNGINKLGVPFNKVFIWAPLSLFFKNKDPFLRHGQIDLEKLNQLLKLYGFKSDTKKN